MAPIILDMSFRDPEQLGDLLGRAHATPRAGSRRREPQTVLK